MIRAKIHQTLRTTIERVNFATSHEHHSDQVYRPSTTLYTCPSARGEEDFSREALHAASTSSRRSTMEPFLGGKKPPKNRILCTPASSVNPRKRESERDRKNLSSFRFFPDLDFSESKSIKEWIINYTLWCC